MELLTTAEVMAQLRVSRTTLYRLSCSGKLRPVHVTGSDCLRYRSSDVARFVKAL